MARYSKKISEKIEKAKGSTAPPPKKAGRDILLIILIIINFVFLVLGWPQLINIDKGIYILLEGALLSIYAQRHADLNEKASEYVKYLSFIFMGLAFALFIYSVYTRYIAA